jgi:hypothetical protein
LGKGDPIAQWKEIVKGYDSKGVPEAIKEANDEAAKLGIKLPQTPDIVIIILFTVPTWLIVRSGIRVQGRYAELAVAPSPKKSVISALDTENCFNRGPPP